MPADRHQSIAAEARTDPELRSSCRLRKTRPGGVFGPSAASYFETHPTAIRIDRPGDSSISVRRIFTGRKRHYDGPWGIHLWGLSSMPASDNPPFPAALRLFSVAVIIVLIVGA
ncbi:MAG: hypothetical protein E5X42_31215, partial [Mesorhizobium sp.]